MVDSSAWSPTWRWLAAGALASVAVSATLVLTWRESDRVTRPVSHLPHDAPVRPTPAPVSTPLPPSILPSFEVVRVASDGSAVIAGRAAPGEQVTVREGGREIAQGQADAQGAFVIVPAAPLPPGTGELTLSARSPGQPAQAGAGAVVLAVPPRETGAEEPETAAKPLAVLVGSDAPRVLQVPGAPQPGHLGLQSLDYDPRGATRFTGTAPPGARVRLYVDNNLAGEAPAGTDGLWTLSPSSKLPPGRHRLRLDQLGANGRVVARVEVPFLQDELAARDLPPGSVIVEPGASLWRIARASYGSGTRYLVIFRANRHQIRRPGRIYPGQVFSVPSIETPASAATDALEPPR